MLEVVNKFLQKDLTGQESVNCHKFVLYVLGKMSWAEMVADSPKIPAGDDFTFGKSAREISDIPFVPVENLENLHSLADKNCEPGQAYIGQILDAETGEMAHSFIVERAANGTYTCYDKPGFKYPFSVGGLEKIYNFVNKNGEKSYQNQKWRFVTMVV